MTHGLFLKTFYASRKDHFLLLNNLKSEENKEITDYVIYTLNSPWGKTISALINLALRKARVDEKNGIKSDTKWSIELKQKYEEILDKKSSKGIPVLGNTYPSFIIWTKNGLRKKSSRSKMKRAPNTGKHLWLDIYTVVKLMMTFII